MLTRICLDLRDRFRSIFTLDPLLKESVCSIPQTSSKLPLKPYSSLVKLISVDIVEQVIYTNG